VSTQLTAAWPPPLFSLIRLEKNSERAGIHRGNPRLFGYTPAELQRITASKNSQAWL
jgi:hypothetical protein